jgi:hypothetical protein
MRYKITLLVLLFISTFGFSQINYEFVNAAGDWENPINWVPFGIPTAIDNVTIPGAAICTINNPGAVSNTVVFNVGGNLIITPTGTLTTNIVSQTGATSFIIDSNATNSGSVIVNSGHFGNTATYQRYLSGGVWHLISDPLSNSGVTVADFITTHGASMTQSGVKYSLGTYDNAFAANGVSTWKNYTSDGSNPAPASAFVIAKGYEILMNANGTVNYNGVITTTSTNFSLTDNVTGWNLIGNPFPSSIFVNTNAHVTDNFLTTNSTQLDPSYVSIYIWNPTNGSYSVVNQATGSTSLAPGQAFFVKSKTDGGTASFNTNMRTHQSTSNFQKTATAAIPTINLTVANNVGTVKSTEIKYMSGTTLGLDPGYDAGQFGGVGTSNLNLYTHLVQDNGVKFGLQVVPDTDYETTIIPIGMNANSGTQITFKATATNLPSDKKVFIEDKLLNKVTEINNTDKSYSVNLSTSLSGKGRFFLHTKANSTLSIDDYLASKYSLVTSSEKQNIRLYGAVTEKGSLNIFDTFGRKIHTAKLQTGTEQNISVPRMSSGIYIVKFNIDNKSFSKKILWY